MPMIDSDTFKTELDAVERARKALSDIYAKQTQSNHDSLKFETTRLLEEYHEANQQLAYQVKKQVERAGG